MSTPGLHATIVTHIDEAIAAATKAMVEQVIGSGDGRRIIDSMLDARSLTTECAPQPVAQ